MKRKPLLTVLLVVLSFAGGYVVGLNRTMPRSDPVRSVVASVTEYVPKSATSSKKAASTKEPAANKKTKVPKATATPTPKKSSLKDINPADAAIHRRPYA